MKLNLYLGRGDESWAPMLLERIEEEGGQASQTLKYLVKIGLGVSDPRENVVVRDEVAGTMAMTLRLPLDLWGWLSEETFRRRKNQAAVLRDLVYEASGIPRPEKPKRAPRDRALSNEIIMEAQADSFNEMRKVRSSPPPEEMTEWDHAEAHPEGVTLVFGCCIKGCIDHQVTWHRHRNSELGNWIRLKRGELKLDNRTGKWEEVDTPSSQG